MKRTNHSLRKASPLGGWGAVKGLAMALLLLPSLCALGQDTLTSCSLPPASCPPNKEVLHSTMFGVGWANILDTYLSPYNYKGTDVRIQRETQRMTTLWNGRVSNQSLIDFNAAFTKNHVRDVKEYAGGIRYSQGWFYHFGKTPQGLPITGEVPKGRRGSVTFAAGLAASGYLGVVYINRTGNNPAQAKADLMIDASAMASYDMVIARHHYLWRYQFFIPVMGIAFSPAYGQSYYEAFELGHHDHNVLFAYPGNMPSMRHRLTLDIPVRRHTLRLGYAAQFNQSTFNHLKYHSWTHDLMIGFNKYLYRR